MILALVLSVLPLHVGATSNKDAAAWARSQEGVKRDVDGNGCWCTDLATAYINYCWLRTHDDYRDPWGTYPYTTRNANEYDDYLSNNPCWTIIQCNSSTVPQPGDLFVSNRNSDSRPDIAACGHVGIVLSVNGNNSAEIIEMADGVGARIRWVTWGSIPEFTPAQFIRYYYFDNVDTYANLGDDFYGVILNTAFWKPISQTQIDTKIYLDTENGRPVQKWRFQRQPDGAYVITSCFNGKALELTDGKCEVGVQLTAQNTFWGGNYQQWYLIPQGDGYIFLSIIDLPGGISDDNTKIQIYHRTGSYAQIWSIYTGDEVQLKATELSATVNAQKVKLKWKMCYGAGKYALKIWNNREKTGNPVYSLSNAPSGIEVELQPGTYYACVETKDYYQTKTSNTVSFTIPKTDTGDSPGANPFRFDDVRNESAFYFDAVYWAYNAKPQITNGLDKTHFGPNVGCTRGQVVTFLWRAAGCPEPRNIKTVFTDVGANAFYAKAVAWAVEKGITKGVSNTTFAPNNTCTRGQIVTFLWRFVGSPAPRSTDTGFTDVGARAFYAKAVAWAVQRGVTNGMTKNTFAPEATCTRGQIVTFLYRAMVG